MIADINVTVTMNSRKLQQIQDFEKRAFGSVNADAFHNTLLTIEAKMGPLVHRVQERITTPVFGLHLFNKYTIGGAAAVM